MNTVRDTTFWAYPGRISKGGQYFLCENDTQHKCSDILKNYK